MQRGSGSVSQDVAQLEHRDQDSSIAESDRMSTIDSALYSQVWIVASPRNPGRPQGQFLDRSSSGDPFPGDETHRASSGMNVADFVEQVFIPEYVMAKRAAGRAHFLGILKHVLSPERIGRTVGKAGKSRGRLAVISGWPYLDDVLLSELSPRHVEELIQASIGYGYSSQTVTHVRNVIRIILAYAEACGCFTGPNPATLVAVPSIAHKRVRTLTLTELKQVFQFMHYPEEQIALFSLLTDMNVAEICGLKWKHVNLTSVSHHGTEETLRARTIAVKMQIYRGEYRPVIGRRDRLVPIPELLQSSLQHLKHRPEYSSSDDFVLASTCGTAVNPDNIAARRLKTIGRVLDLSWLSWKVFHRTGIELRSKFGRHMSRELGNALTLKC